MSKSKTSFNNKQIIAIVAFALVAIIGIGVGIMVSVLKSRVQFYLDVDGTSKSQTLKVGATISDLSAPEKKYGYDFAGWFKDPSFEIEPEENEKITSGTHYYAKYVKKECDIVFSSDNKTFSIKKVYETSFEMPDEIDDSIRKQNYNLVGWSKTQNTKWSDENVIDLNSEINVTAEEMVFYAVWKGRTNVTLTLNTSDLTNNGTTINLRNAVDGVVTLFYGDDYSLNVIEDETIKNLERTTNKLDKFGGFVLENSLGSKTYKNGETIEQVLENSVLKINWIDPDSTLEFDLNLDTLYGGETYSSEVEKMAVKLSGKPFVFNNLPVLDDSKFNNYTFVGWSLSKQSAMPIYTTSFETQQKENKLYAVYKGIDVTVSINTEKARVGINKLVIKDEIVEYGKNYRFPSVPVLLYNEDDSGSKFGGFKHTATNKFYKSNQEIVMDFSGGKVTFDINWVRKTVIGSVEYEIVLPEGLTQVEIDNVVTPEISVVYEEDEVRSVTIAQAPGELENYDFVEWNTASDGSGTSYNALQVITPTSTIKVYSIWVGKQRTASLDKSTIKEDCKNLINLVSANYNYGEDYTLPGVSDETIELLNHKTNEKLKFGGFIVNGVEGYASNQTLLAVTASELEIEINWVSVDSYLEYNLNFGSLPYGSETNEQVPTAVKKFEVLEGSYSYVVAEYDDSTLRNYKFVEWNTAGDGSGTRYMPNDQFTGGSENILYAIYEGKDRTIRINYTCGEETITPVEWVVKFGSTITLEPKFPEGYSSDSYDFKGYYEVPTCNTTPLNVNYRVTFGNDRTNLIKDVYVVLTYAKVTFSFDANGGASLVNEMEVRLTNRRYTFAENEILDLKQNIVLTSYKLIGFAFSSSATTGSFEINMASDYRTAVTLYAVWERDIDVESLLANGIDLGEYPQTYVGDTLNEILKIADVTANAEDAEDKLLITGRTFTTDVNGETLTIVEYLYNGEKVAKLEQVVSTANNYSTGDEVVQDEVSFFKVEPIHWDIYRRASDNKFVAISHSLLGSSKFSDYSEESRGGATWKDSYLREFLNEVFMLEAELQDYIEIETHYESSMYNEEFGEEVEDYIWCLSYGDVINGVYFNEIGNDYSGNANSPRIKQATDFALATCSSSYNATTESEEVFNGNGMYWLRSCDYAVDYNGSVMYREYYYTFVSFSPAFVLDI